MKCPECGGSMSWVGSMARGGFKCLGCKPVPNAIMERYAQEMYAWHRKWCKAMQVVPINPMFCDCGHAEDSPYTEAQIIQKERAHYGEAT